MDSRMRNRHQETPRRVEVSESARIVESVTDSSRTGSLDALRWTAWPSPAEAAGGVAVDELPLRRAPGS